MSLAVVYLIKTAVNRARALQRSGQLSASATKRLRREGMLPTVSQNVAGLERGNLNLINKYKIRVPGRVRNALAAGEVIFPLEAAGARGLRSWTNFADFDAAMRGKPAVRTSENINWMAQPIEARTGITPPVLGQAQQREFAAGVTRHELKEYIELLRRMQRAGLTADDLEAGASLSSKKRYFSHVKPSIVKEERGITRGLSRPTQEYFETLRATRYPERTIGPDQYVIAEDPAKLKLYNRSRALELERLQRLEAESLKRTKDWIAERRAALSKGTNYQGG